MPLSFWEKLALAYTSFTETYTEAALSPVEKPKQPTNLSWDDWTYRMFRYIHNDHYYANKAYTALVNRLSTAELGAQCQPGGPLYGLQNNLGGRMVIFPGGVPIWRNGVLIGAVGASGGTVEQDHACASAGVIVLME